MTPKFRVWDSVEKKFVEHFFITDNGLICNMEKPTSDSKLLIPIEKSELILMQSTGLKDKNGVEIFEGDVVSRNSGMPSVVKFGKWIYEEDFGYKIKNIGFHLNSSCDDDEWFQAMDYEDIRKNYEVIGNIYENPELLEDKE
ncbi:MULTISPECIES: YopX family protein [unclassified Streptococcus]|uniref:YopX family protein n=1 Tax=unclassified Streptococcus TaxID=2608887 RepID=UPI001566EBEA|nr:MULTISPECIES: YopX family protein [unclassified Streptococcus]